MLYLIDELGRTLKPSSSLPASFGTRMRAEEFPDFLIRNQGCIALRVGTSEVELRICPDKVKPHAVSTGLQLLLDVEARRNACQVSEGVGTDTEG